MTFSNIKSTSINVRDVQNNTKMYQMLLFSHIPIIIICLEIQH